MEAATGERIVAFGRTGKPPELRFLRRLSTASNLPAGRGKAGIRNGF
jgi:hypothetical protein